MAAIIEPRVLKGFRDFLPPAEMIRRIITESIEASLRSFGFVPIDTPALEYAEILFGKSLQNPPSPGVVPPGGSGTPGGSETEKQIYRFTDSGGRDVALRFDLTVPFARYAALHQQELHFPFKRYHIGKVWRGENTQRGRYREFTQCDFDIIGSDSPAADFEILLMIRSTLQSLGLDVTIKVNHRGLFNRFLSHIGLEGRSVEILRTVDKLAKTGIDVTRESLIAIAGEANTQKLLEFISAGRGSAADNSFENTLERITALSGGPSPESERLAMLKRFMNDSGAGSGDFSLDPSITRGLDYYTGVVFETFLTELPDIGSICSGGRYDNLAGLYSKNCICGVGSSIGLDRMIAALESLDKLPAVSGFSVAAIACIKQEDSGLYQALAAKFRQAGIPCEVLLEPASGQLVKQFVLAEKKGLRWIIIPGENPLNGPLTIRNLAGRKNIEGLSVDDIIAMISDF
ncbi:MAG: histidine--tRNA ligase [Treponema sp.]|nr:histidine--tRNA ligase [Treponema sp.]